MKYLFLLLEILIVSVVHAQEHSSPAGADKYFIVQYTPGSAWSKSKPANEQEYFKEHSTHLSELRKANHIDIGGRYENTLMLLVRAKTEEEAKFLVQDDPAVKNKLFKIELFPFNPVFNGCVR